MIKRYSYIKYFLVYLIFYSCNEDTVEVRLPKGFCGHSFVVFSNIEKTKELISDEKGILYASKDDIIENNKFKKIRIKQDGIEISKECINFIEGVKFYGKENKKIEYLYFYKKCSKEDVVSIPLVDILFCDYIKTNKIARLSKEVCR